MYGASRNLEDSYLKTQIPCTACMVKEYIRGVIMLIEGFSMARAYFFVISKDVWMTLVDLTKGFYGQLVATLHF
jgi:hypothetical protein